MSFWMPSCLSIRSSLHLSVRVCILMYLFAYVSTLPESRVLIFVYNLSFWNVSLHTRSFWWKRINRQSWKFNFVCFTRIYKYLYLILPFKSYRDVWNEVPQKLYSHTNPMQQGTWKEDHGLRNVNENSDIHLVWRQEIIKRSSHFIRIHYLDYC